jgi:ribosome-binding protein aMBF1 (putative translation factor)
MQKNYQVKFRDALEGEDISVESMAEDTGIPVEDLEALRDGRVVGENVSRDAIEVVEKVLDVELKEDV